MRRFISSFTTAFLFFLPTTAAAQQFGGGFQPNWQQNQFGGDTVLYEGRVLTNNLPPNTDTCGWVRSQGLSCQYERWDSNSRTHFVRSIPNNSWGNGWNNRYGRQPVPIWSGGGCVYQNTNVRILCN